MTALIQLFNDYQSIQYYTEAKKQMYALGKLLKRSGRARFKQKILSHFTMNIVTSFQSD